MSKNTNLSFLTDYITADITNGRIGINTPSPAYAFDVTGIARTSTSTYLATASGKLGIGTTTPTDKLEVQDGDLSTYHNANASTAGYGINFYTNGGGSKNSLAYIVLSQVGTARSGDLLFLTSNSGAPAERMRITSGGFLLVGQTASNPIISNTVGVRIGSESIFSNSSSEAVSIQRLNSTGTMVAFYYNSGSAYTPVGNISTNGSTITFSGSALSDVRYKENITPITNALESINKVDWVEFKFKENQKNSAGVTAQQLQTIDALSKFVINGSDEESYKAVDYNAIIGYLGKAIQELSAEIETLKNK